MTLCLSNVTMPSSLNNYPIEMRLECRLGKIYACFDCLDKLCSGIWAWCVDAIVDKLGILTLIEFYDGSLICTIVVRESR